MKIVMMWVIAITGWILAVSQANHPPMKPMFIADGPPNDRSYSVVMEEGIYILSAGREKLTPAWTYLDVEMNPNIGERCSPTIWVDTYHAIYTFNVCREGLIGGGSGKLENLPRTAQKTLKKGRALARIKWPELNVPPAGMALASTPFF